MLPAASAMFWCCRDKKAAAREREEERAAAEQEAERIRAAAELAAEQRRPFDVTIHLVGKHTDVPGESDDDEIPSLVVDTKIPLKVSNTYN